MEASKMGKPKDEYHLAEMPVPESTFSNFLASSQSPSKTAINGDKYKEILSRYGLGLELEDNQLSDLAVIREGVADQSEREL